MQTFTESYHEVKQHQRSQMNSQYIVDTRLPPSNNLAWIKKKQLRKLPICQRVYLKSKTMLFKQATSAVRHIKWFPLNTWNAEYIGTEMRNNAKNELSKNLLFHFYLTIPYIPHCSASLPGLLSPLSRAHLEVTHLRAFSRELDAHQGRWWHSDY